MARLRNLIAKIDRIGVDVDRKFLEHVVERARELILDELQYIPDHEMRTYEIERIDAYVATDGKGKVVMLAPHAPFVEFGTGIYPVGEHPLAGEISEQGYTKGGTGKAYWTYPVGEHDFITTIGMESRPFVYNAMIKLEAEYGDMIEVELRYGGL